MFICSLDSPLLSMNGRHEWKGGGVWPSPPSSSRRNFNPLPNFAPIFEVASRRPLLLGWRPSLVIRLEAITTRLEATTIYQIIVTIFLYLSQTKSLLGGLWRGRRNSWRSWRRHPVHIFFQECSICCLSISFLGRTLRVHVQLQAMDRKEQVKRFRTTFISISRSFT